MTPSPPVPCLVCTTALTLRLVRGRKSGKPFLMLIVPLMVVTSGVSSPSEIMWRESWPGWKARHPVQKVGLVWTMLISLSGAPQLIWSGLTTNESRPLRPSQHQR
jgi:hypothetical protein